MIYSEGNCVGRRHCGHSPIGKLLAYISLFCHNKKGKWDVNNGYLNRWVPLCAVSVNWDNDSFSLVGKMPLFIERINRLDDNMGISVLTNLKRTRGRSPGKTVFF